MKERRQVPRYYSKPGTQAIFTISGTKLQTVTKPQNVKDISSCNCSLLTDNVTKLQIGHKGTVTFLRGSNRDDITNATIKRVKGNTVAMSFPQTTSTYKYQDVRRYLNETINRNIIFEIGEVPEPKRVRTRTSQIYRLLQSNVGILTKQIVVAQIAGFILILFTSIILGVCPSN